MEVKGEWKFENETLDRHPELKTQPIVEQNPLNMTDALYGRRIEAMRIHYKIQEGETIQFVDVMSSTLLFANISSSLHVTLKFTWVMRTKTEVMLHKEDVINCSILPTKRLYQLFFHFTAITDCYSTCKDVRHGAEYNHRMREWECRRKSINRYLGIRWSTAGYAGSITTHWGVWCIWIWRHPIRSRNRRRPLCIIH